MVINFEVFDVPQRKQLNDKDFSKRNWPKGPRLGYSFVIFSNGFDKKYFLMILSQRI